MEDFERKYYRAGVDIDLSAIRDNVDAIRKLLMVKTMIMAVVKADAYGHGAVSVARALDDKVEAFAVAIIDEALELRNAGISKPILILGYTAPVHYSDIVKYDITQTIFNYEDAVALNEEAAKQNKQAVVHIKVDTGMGRIGYTDTTLLIDDIEKMLQLENIYVEGLFTHLATADEENKDFAYKQYERYMDILGQLWVRGIEIPVRHVANSAAIIDLPEMQMDMVRCGIAMYGMYPSDTVNKEKLELKPAMDIKSHISFVKEVEAGTGISYGKTFVTEKKTKVATIPVGYGDGYARALSSKGRVLINGKSAPILGRVCMDQFMVDVTDIENVYQGTEVTLLGRDGDEVITMEEISDLAGSFNYEFACTIGKRLPRRYKD